MKNKLLSFVLILTLVCTSLLGFGSAAVASSYVNVDGDYAKSADVLSIVCPGLIKSGEGNYTRAEFVSAVIGLLKMPSDPAAKTPFSDIPDKAAYTSAVKSALDLGLISGTNLFYPDSPITYAQALKIVMTAIGYGKLAEIRGGYPTGYLIAAHDAEIGETLQLANEAPVSYAQGAELLYDMVTTDLIEVTGFGDSYEYTKTADRNILSVYHDILIAEGVVDANEYTGLYSKNAYCGESRIAISGVTFAGEGYHDLIGECVRIFYRDNNQRTIVYAYAKYDNSKTFTADYDLEISGSRFSALSPDEVEPENYKLSAEFAIIYNGKAYASTDYNTLVNPAAGYVTIIDNDDDGVYDIISVESIEYGVISSVNVAEAKIYDKYKPNGMIDMSSGEFAYHIYNPAGEKVEIDALENDSVVGYVLSADKLLLKVYMYDKKAGGTIAEKTSDGSIVVNGTAYKLSDYYTKYIKESSKIAPGMETILWLTDNNEVVYINEYISKMKYGYLVAQKPTTGLDSTVLIKLFSVDGMLTPELASKVIFNGEPTSASELSDDLDAVLDKDIAYRGVKFALNAEGKITKLYTADDWGETSIFEHRATESKPLIFKEFKGTYRSGILSPYIRFASGCTFLKVPASEDYRLDDERYEVYTSSKLSTATSSIYDVVAYDVDASGAADFVILKQDSGGESVGSSTVSAIVEKVYETLDSEGFKVTAARVYADGKWLDVYADEKSLEAVKALAPGDIARISYDSEYKVVAMNHDFVYATKKFGDGSGNKLPDAIVADNNGSELEYYAGPIYSYTDGYAYFLVGQTEIPEVVNQDTFMMCTPISGSNTVYVKVNKDRNGKIESAVVSKEANANNVESWFSAGDEADYLVSRQRYRSVSLHIVYVD